MARSKTKLKNTTKSEVQCFVNTPQSQLSPVQKPSVEEVIAATVDGVALALVVLVVIVLVVVGAAAVVVIFTAFYVSLRVLYI